MHDFKRRISLNYPENMTQIELELQKYDFKFGEKILGYPVSLFTLDSVI